MHFVSFQSLAQETGDVTFSGVIGGSGPPVLLLHGYPQTHLAWCRVAPGLAEEFTVVVPNLPGYGASRAACAGASGALQALWRR